MEIVMPTFTSVPTVAAGKAAGRNSIELVSASVELVSVDGYPIVTNDESPVVVIKALPLGAATDGALEPPQPTKCDAMMALRINLNMIVTPYQRIFFNSAQKLYGRAMARMNAVMAMIVVQLMLSAYLAGFRRGKPYRLEP